MKVSVVCQSAVYTYDGTPKSLVADVPAGCTQVVQTFTGTNGTAYGPTTEPPTNPGVYNVKVSYTMQSGYEELQPWYRRCRGSGPQKWCWPATSLRRQ